MTGMFQTDSDIEVKWMVDPTKGSQMKKRTKHYKETHPGQHSEPSIGNMGASCSFKNPKNPQIHTCNLKRLFGEFGLAMRAAKANHQPASRYEESSNELHCGGNGLDLVWITYRKLRP